MPSAAARARRSTAPARTGTRPARQHGSLNPRAHHLGDLPNLDVDANGAGRLEFTIAGADARDGAHGLVRCRRRLGRASTQRPTITAPTRAAIAARGSPAACWQLELDLDRLSPAARARSTLLASSVGDPARADQSASQREGRHDVEREDAGAEAAESRPPSCRRNRGRAPGRPSSCRAHRSRPAVRAHARQDDVLQRRDRGAHPGRSEQLGDRAGDVEGAEIVGREHHPDGRQAAGSRRAC